MPGIYLEPIGLLYGAVAREAVTAGGALPLAGSTTIAFGAVRLWEGEPGNVKYAVVRTTTIQAIDELRVKELLDKITAPRPAIAGISLETPRVMGIVNVTPDSFSDSGEHFDAEAAIRRARTLASEGADFVDIGGESTRPGSEPVAVEEELRRILPVLRGLAGLGVPVSIDTRKPAIMREAANAGAAIINDVSALTFDSTSLGTAAELMKPAVLMHAKGAPKTMQDDPIYEDVVIEVYDYLEGRIGAAEAAGLPRAGIIADPGIGFGKTLTHNLALLRSMSVFHGLGTPLLLGTSRKGFIQKITGEKDPSERVAASIATALDAISQGVQIVRVHDVGPTCQAIAAWRAVREGHRTGV